MAASETQAEQHSQHLNYKTTVLKVSIHCAGCKRKVHKILQNIQGVQNIDIDLKQQKVIVTGNVNSDILIHKLTNKTGKHVELWPEPTESKKKKQPKPEKNKEKQSDSETENSEEIEIKQNSENNNNGTGKVDTSTSKNVQVNGNTAKSGNGSGDSKVNKPNEGSTTGKTGVVHVQELKPEVRKQTVVLPAKPVAEKKVSVAVQFPNDDNEEPLTNEKTGSTGNTGGDSSGVKKKKKKGKGKVVNNNVEESVVNVEHFRDAPGTGGSGNRSNGQFQSQSSNFHGQVHSGSNLTNEVPPRHYINEQFHPPQYYGPPQSHFAAAPPVVTVSHHTAYPSSSSYGAAYYAPPQPYQYAHVMNTGNEMEPQPRPYTYEPESYNSSQPSDSFVYFSDENPNACNVM